MTRGESNFFPHDHFNFSMLIQKRAELDGSVLDVGLGGRNDMGELLFSLLFGFV